MKLAIKGHLERGKEVIKLLEMMGGVNTHQHSGKYGKLCVYCGIIYVTSEIIPGNYALYTLEQFEQKFPFKIGDNVSYIDNNGNIINTSISGMSWHEEKHTIWYQLATGATRFVENIWKTMKQKELKDYLKPGYVVEYDDGDQYVIIQDVHGNVFGTQLGKTNQWAPLKILDRIVSVYQINKPTNLHWVDVNSSAVTKVWERKEVELTMQEIADKFGIDVNQLKIKK